MPVVALSLSLSRISPRLESVSEDADAELGEGDRCDPHFQAVCRLLGYYKEHTLSFRGNFRHLSGRARGWQLTAKRSSNFVWCNFP